jgi:fructose-6-phosphate aldolase 2
MIYMADTADLKALKKIIDFFPIEGVTTNPTILKEAGEKFSVAIDNILKIIGDRMIHIQLISTEPEAMLAEAKKYRDYFDLGDNYYAKIPVTQAGYKAMRLLKEEGIQVTATAIFTQQQALVAAKSGADYVAPYVTRLDNISSHGIEVVGDIVTNMQDYKLKTKVLAASFKTVDQVYRVSMEGSHSATINPDLLMQMVKHPMTDISVDQFIRDGEGLYDIQL